jgi:hypothetical protein
MKVNQYLSELILMQFECFPFRTTLGPVEGYPIPAFLRSQISNFKFSYTSLMNQIFRIMAGGLMLAIVCSGYAQTKRASTPPSRAGKSSWRVFAPRRMGFRIEFPAKPHRIDGEYADTEGYKSVDVYGVSQLAPRREYQVIVLVPADGIHKEDPDWNKLGRLKFMIGGDDNAIPTRQSDISVPGLKGKEFTYDFPANDALGHRKGQIIDARTRIFVLIYGTNTASDLNSSAAARFFHSFKAL